MRSTCSRTCVVPAFRRRKSYRHSEATGVKSPLRSALQRYLDVFVRFPKGLETIREARNVAAQLPLLAPQKLLVELDELEEALRCGVVVSSLALEKLSRYLHGSGARGVTSSMEREQEGQSIRKSIFRYDVLVGDVPTFHNHLGRSVLKRFLLGSCLWWWEVLSTVSTPHYPSADLITFSGAPVCNSRWTSLLTPNE